MVADQEWESILQIKTAGRDDSRFRYRASSV